ncbi:MAG: hypothetical protein OXN84_21305 [Albidovulum sp.]|nr:hypothetical protein [Albidovulum sp.]MDE0531173.1 hypothetical protein [Albidovulum sp.]
MAVIDSEIELLDGQCGKVDEPREKLYHFARGEAKDCFSPQHLVVFGAGRYNERLADALVTEAALASLPLGSFGKLKPKSKWRRARKLSFARLRDYDPSNLTTRELPYNPVMDLRVERIEVKSGGGRKVVEVKPAGCIQRQQPSNDCNDVETISAAGLVVVTRCNPCPGALCKVAAKLAKNKGQNTVWCFDKKYGKCAKKKADVLCALRSKLGEDSKVGIVYCRE